MFYLCSMCPPNASRARGRARRRRLSLDPPIGWVDVADLGGLSGCRAVADGSWLGSRGVDGWWVVWEAFLRSGECAGVDGRVRSSWSVLLSERQGAPGCGLARG